MGAWTPGPGATNGDDVFVGDDSDETAAGLAGEDTLNGGGGADTLDGGLSADTLNGGDGDDLLIASTGNDVFNGGNGVDTVSYDTLIYEPPQGQTSLINLENGTGAIFAGQNFLFHQFNSIENIRGGNSAERIFGNATANTLWGGGGSDLLEGRAGNDRLEGESGDDVILGEDGEDQLLGGDGDDTLSGGAGADAINGENGFDFASYATAVSGVTVSLLLQNSAQNTVGDGVDTLSNIEGLVGSAFNDTLTGDGSDNTLVGGASADALNGGSGVDTVSYFNSPTGVTLNLATGIHTGGDAQGDTFTDIEIFRGSDLASDTMIGDAHANIFYGGSWHDTLSGGGGDDILEGGDGFDTLNGDDGADVLRGDLRDDTLNGGAGDDTLIGGGPSTEALDGADILNGGDGFDTADYSTESGGIVVGFTNLPILQVWDPSSSIAANDQLYSIERVIGTSFNDQLTYFSGNTSITFVGGAGDDRLIGGNLSDVLQGGVGADYLDGALGADTMTGGDGSDLYVINDVGDVIIETAVGEIDTVEASLSHTLGANFENLILTSEFVSGEPYSGHGNALDNLIVGNYSANTLTGADGNDTLDGGLDADNMAGGNGNDTYVVRDAGDIVSETSSAGVDVVYALVAYTLTDHVEELRLAGIAAIAGTGNALNNVITGNSAANVLSGLAGADRLDGGLGADTLQGGAQADTFVFSSALSPGNIDAITDFNIADDTIELSSAVFAALAVGALGAGAFRIGASAADSDDRIIYNSATGALYYDADGIGAAKAVQFATLAPGLALTHSDFVITGPVAGAPNSEIVSELPFQIKQSFTLAANLTYQSYDPIRLAMSNSGDVFLNLGTIEATLQEGIFVESSSGLFDNSGSLIVTGAPGFGSIPGFPVVGLTTFGTSTVSIVNNGLWSVTGFEGLYGGRLVGGTTVGILYDGLGGAIINNGTMIVTGDPYAGGIICENPAIVTNNGALNVTARIGVAEGITHVAFHSGVITNTGEITVTAPGLTFGIAWWGLESAVAAPNIVNSGTITADVALLSFQPGGASVLDKVEWVHNTGTINGVIDLYRGNDRIDNEGVINGDVFMWIGNDLVDTTLGVINGFVYLEAGDDEFRGGAAADYTVGGDGDDIINGAGGDDFLEGDAGADTLNGGDGFDLVSYEFASAAVTVSLLLQGGAQNTGGDGIDTLSNIEDLAGSAFNDTLTGDGSGNYLFGLAGNDNLVGNGGADVISGDAGNDVLDAGAGADRMDGGDGDDRIYWDAGDDLAFVQGGSGIDTLVVTGSAIPASFNLGAHGFERGEQRIIDTGSELWSSQITNYDAAWLADFARVNNDNGSYSVIDFDQLSAFDWTTNFDAYDSLGRRDVNVTVFDSGITSAYDFDQAGTFNWTSNWNQYTASGALDINETVFDNGATTSMDFDADNAFNWTSNWLQHDAGGLLDLNETVYDNGVTSSYDYDQADAFAWASNWNQYAPGGALDINVTVFDDGSSNSNDFDQANAFTWASTFNSYVVGGAIDYTITTHDNGNYAVLDYDQGNQFAWATIWQLYDPNGVLLDYKGVNDDGSLFGGP